MGWPAATPSSLQRQEALSTRTPPPSGAAKQPVDCAPATSTDDCHAPQHIYHFKNNVPTTPKRNSMSSITDLIPRHNKLRQNWAPRQLSVCEATLLVIDSANHARDCLSAHAPPYLNMYSVAQQALARGRAATSHPHAELRTRLYSNKPK
jgi:hypothetical protein